MNCPLEAKTNEKIKINTQLSPNDSEIHLKSGNSATPKKLILPENFVPGDNDVIVGRGKKCYNHTGNQRLKQIVVSKLDAYSTSACKFDKSAILTSILDELRAHGGFVKRDSQTGRWYDVGDLLAREKISQAFRDELCSNYKSSVVFKRQRRQERRAAAAAINIDSSPSSSWHQMRPNANRVIASSSSSSKLSQIQLPLTPDNVEAMFEKLNWHQKISLSSSLTLLDLESSSDHKLANVAERLSSSLPNIGLTHGKHSTDNSIEPGHIEEASKLAFTVPMNLSLHGMDYDDDSMEPIPISQAFNMRELGDDYSSTPLPCPLFENIVTPSSHHSIVGNNYSCKDNFFKEQNGSENDSK